MQKIGKPLHTPVLLHKSGFVPESIFAPRVLIGSNDIDSLHSIDEIMSNFQNLLTYIKSRSSTKIIVSEIIPRPCDLPKDPSDRRVKDMDKGLKLLCKRRNLPFLHTGSSFTIISLLGSIMLLTTKGYS